MKKVLVIMALVLALCCVGAAADLLEPGERTIGVDVPAGWYSVTMGESGFSASQVYLPDGCVLDLPETALLVPVAGELQVPDAEEGGGTEQLERSPMGWLLYDDDYLSVYFSNLYVEEYSTSSYLMTEYMFVNKTDEIIRFVCDSIIVNGCGISISKFIDIPGNAQYIHEWTNGAELYKKYGITEVETFSMVLEYSGEKNIPSVWDKQTDTIRIK